MLPRTSSMANTKKNESQTERNRQSVLEKGWGGGRGREEEERGRETDRETVRETDRERRRQRETELRRTPGFESSASTPRVKFPQVKSPLLAFPKHYRTKS